MSIRDNLLEHLELALLHLEAGRKHVDQQRRMIAKLQSKGLCIEAASHQLDLFETTLKKFEEDGQSERARNEMQIRALAREAEHRYKNLLARVKAVVRLSESETVDGLKEAIEARIEALTNLHSLFLQSRWKGAELGSLVKQELSPYSGGGEMRTLINGSAVILKPDVAQAIAVALHELATNAAKYGALSVTTGQVRVEWSHVKGGQLVLRWTEAGGPLVNPPTRRGFGISAMESMIRDGVRGRVQFDWCADGLACEITLPT